MAVLHTVVFRLAHPAGSEAETAIPGVEDFVVRRQVGEKLDA